MSTLLWVLDKGIRWNERRKERKKSHQSCFQWLSSQWAVQSSWAHIQPWLGGTFLPTSFSLCMQISSVQNVLSGLYGMGQRAPGVLGGLDLPLHSMPSCKPCSCSCVVLYCAYPQEWEQGCMAWKSGALLPHGSLLQPRLVLSCGMFLPAILVCLLPAVLGWLHSHLAIVFETRTLAPYPLGFYKEAVLRGEKWNRLTGSLNRVGKTSWRHWQHNSNEVHFESQDEIRL